MLSPGHLQPATNNRFVNQAYDSRAGIWLLVFVQRVLGMRFITGFAVYKTVHRTTVGKVKLSFDFQGWSRLYCVILETNVFSLVPGGYGRPG